MEIQKWILQAEQEGFEAAVIPAASVPTNPDFRRYCAENRCGQYGTNYSCPPVCGTPEQMRERIEGGQQVLVLKGVWPIDGYQDVAGMLAGKRSHNMAMLRLKKRMEEAGWSCEMAGGSCCCLCDKCTMPLGKPCVHPELRFSCLSAYCVDVEKLAQRCGMAFSWDTRQMLSFGMLILKPAE